MKILSPTTNAQEIKIIPRDPTDFSTLSLTITDEGSKETETITSITAWEDGDYIVIQCAYSILNEHRLYNIEITQDGTLWWRGRARCTSQSDKTVKHKLNTVADSSLMILPSDEDYTIIV